MTHQEARIVELEAALEKEAGYHEEEAECHKGYDDAFNYHTKRAAKIRAALKETS